MNRASRRKFLQTAGIGLGAFLAKDQVLQLIQDMAQWSLVQAQAENTGSMPKKYINLHFSGAPPRWLFDHWVTAFEGNLAAGLPAQDNIWNIGLANAISSSGDLTHETFNHAYTNYNGQSKTIKLPHHLAGKVAGPNNTLRSISDLFKNMAVIQGYNSNTDGHSVNAPISVFPDPAVPSLNGSVADQRKDPIPAIGTNAVFSPFKSGKSKTLTSVNIWPAGQSVGGYNDGALGNLMSVFRPDTYSNSILANQSAYKVQVDTFKNSFMNLANTSDANAGSLLEQYQGLESLLPFTSAASLTTEWNRLYTKYATIMNKSVELNNDGFRVPKLGFGNNTGETTASAYPVRIDRGTTANGDSVYGAADPTNDERITGFLNFEGYQTTPDYDLKNLLTNAGSGAHDRNNPSQAPSSNDFGINSDIISSFALIEFVIVNKISGVISGGTNWNLANVRKHDGTIHPLIPNDQHSTNIHCGIISNTAFWRGVIAGLLELIDVLKTNNMFADTVIHITSDFGRNPRHRVRSSIEKSEGSDHGWDGHVTSVISGAFNNGPVVMGNIKKDGRRNTNDINEPYIGAWGRGGEVDFNGSHEVLSPRHAAAAVAHLAGVSPNPWPFTNLIWKLENGILVPTINETKLV